MSGVKGRLRGCMFVCKSLAFGSGFRFETLKYNCLIFNL